jgi:hypothetical protein
MFALLGSFMTLASPAHAQFGFGFGFGMGYRPYTSEYLNQRSLQAGSAAYASRSSVTNNFYRGNPNAYFNNIRSGGDFVERFDPASRVPKSVQMARLARRSGEVSTAAALQPSAPTAGRVPLPLLAFVDIYNQVNWPAESPVQGELASKRAVSDDATKIVVDEQKNKGVATVASAVAAREKLIGYGRPALEFLTQHATMAITDTFHRFLLGLYDALGNATRPASAAQTTTKPGAGR